MGKIGPKRAQKRAQKRDNASIGMDSIGIDALFHCAMFKKIPGAGFEKIDKVDFRHRHTDIYIQRQARVIL